MKKSSKQKRVSRVRNIADNHIEKLPTSIVERLTTFLWDQDRLSGFDRSDATRDVHDELSLKLAHTVASELIGCEMSEEQFKRYLFQEYEHPDCMPVQSDEQDYHRLMHDRVELIYYYSWLIPMLDQPMRQGLQARYEDPISPDMSTDQSLIDAIDLVTPVISDHWQYKTLQAIYKRCMERVTGIVNGVADSVPSDIDWNTMGESKKQRLLSRTESIRRKLNKERELANALSSDDQAIDPSSDEIEQLGMESSSSSSSTPPSTPPKRLIARMNIGSADRPVWSRKRVKFSIPYQVCTPHD